VVGKTHVEETLPAIISIHLNIDALPIANSQSCMRTLAITRLIGGSCEGFGSNFPSHSVAINIGCFYASPVLDRSVLVKGVAFF
jgi:hypothetical protein